MGRVGVRVGSEGGRFGLLGGSLEVVFGVAVFFVFGRIVFVILLA